MKFRSWIIPVMFISIWGCSNANDGLITLDASGKHPAGWAVATIGSVGSLCLSVQANLPIGATIVCGLGLMLLLAMSFARFRRAR